MLIYIFRFVRKHLTDIFFLKHKCIQRRFHYIFFSIIAYFEFTEAFSSLIIAICREIIAIFRLIMASSRQIIAIFRQITASSTEIIAFFRQIIAHFSLIIAPISLIVAVLSVIITHSCENVVAFLKRILTRLSAIVSIYGIITSSKPKPSCLFGLFVTFPAFWKVWRFGGRSTVLPFSRSSTVSI